MTKRRAHSSIDKLPAELRETLTRMIVDNEWPDDFPKAKALGFGGEDKDIEGKPRYEDLVEYCDFRGFAVSKSAIGRWAMPLKMMSRYKLAGLLSRQAMSGITDEKASQTQKAVAEMVTAVAIEFIASHDDFDAKQIRDVAKAMKDCTAIAINSDKYVREQLTKKVDVAAENMKKRIGNIGGKRKAIQKIIDEELGVIKKS